MKTQWKSINDVKIATAEDIEVCKSMLKQLADGLVGSNPLYTLTHGVGERAMRAAAGLEVLTRVNNYAMHAEEQQTPDDLFLAGLRREAAERVIRYSSDPLSRSTSVLTNVMDDCQRLFWAEVLECSGGTRV
jgi:hypothetical protein